MQIRQDVMGDVWRLLEAAKNLKAEIAKALADPEYDEKELPTGVNDPDFHLAELSAYQWGTTMAQLTLVRPVGDVCTTGWFTEEGLIGVTLDGGEYFDYEVVAQFGH